MDFKWMGKMAAGAAVISGTVGAAAIVNDPYGVCAHVSRKDWDFSFAKQEFALLKEIGINWVRTDYDWAGVNPSSGEWNFSILDQLQKTAKRDGINILPILAYDGKWASPAWKHPDLWREYVRRIVSRYAKELRYWEVWNEQNSTGFWRDTASGENYAKLLRCTYEEIKKIDSELKVVYGGTAGVPLPFIEDSLRAGAGKWFDVMNIHPYHWHGTPENMIPQLQELRKLLQKYGVGHKPIWITEVGWSTAPRPSVHQKAFIAALERAGIDAGKVTAAVIDDPGNGYTNIGEYDVCRDFPMFRKIAGIRLAQLKNLDVRRFPVLLIFDESFPGRYIADVADYVRRGGTLLCSNGLPFYFELRPNGRGGMVSAQVNDKYMKLFHIGWETWWTDKEVPRQIKGVKPAAEFGDDFAGEPLLVANRFLHGRNLAAGDEFIPIIQAENGKYRGTVVALYKLNSDMKGNVIVCTPWAKTESVSEELQAQFLPRTYLIGLAHGVERIFWYNFRSQEWEPLEREHHFGIVHRDLSPKPAYAAYRTLARLCPTGSTVPKLSVNGLIYTAEWTRPDGVKVWAVWAAKDSKTVELKISGRIVEVLNYLGEKQTIPENKIAVGPAVTYLIGPESVGW